VGEWIFDGLLFMKLQRQHRRTGNG